MSSWIKRACGYTLPGTFGSVVDRLQQGQNDNGCDCEKHGDMVSMSALQAPHIPCRFQFAVWKNSFHLVSVLGVTLSLRAFKNTMHKGPVAGQMIRREKRPGYISRIVISYALPSQPLQ